MFLIGISGNLNAGKDTAAGIIAKKYDFTIIAFADPIKRIAQDVFDFTDDQLWGPSYLRDIPDTRYPLNNKDGFLTPRMCLQKLGTSWGRECYDQIWVDYTLRIVKKLQTGGWSYHFKEGIKEDYRAPPQNVIISDSRFENELNGINKYGGKLIRIYRCSTKSEKNNHVSETEQYNVPDEYFSAIIDNSKGLEELNEQIINIMPNIIQCI